MSSVRGAFTTSNERADVHQLNPMVSKELKAYKYGGVAPGNTCISAHKRGGEKGLVVPRVIFRRSMKELHIGIIVREVSSCVIPT